MTTNKDLIDQIKSEVYANSTPAVEYINELEDQGLDTIVTDADIEKLNKLNETLFSSYYGNFLTHDEPLSKETRKKILDFILDDLGFDTCPVPIFHNLSSSAPHMIIRGHLGIVHINLKRVSYYTTENYSEYVQDLAHELRHVQQNLQIINDEVHWPIKNYTIPMEKYLTQEGHDTAEFELDAENYSRRLLEKINIHNITGENE